MSVPLFPVSDPFVPVLPESDEELSLLLPDCDPEFDELLSPLSDPEPDELLSPLSEELSPDVLLLSVVPEEAEDESEDPLLPLSEEPSPDVLPEESEDEEDVSEESLLPLLEEELIVSPLRK